MVDLGVGALVLHLFLLTVLNASLGVGLVRLGEGPAVPVGARPTNGARQGVGHSLRQDPSPLRSGAASSPCYFHPLLRAFWSFP